MREKNEKSPHRWTIQFDGGATPNPGTASCAFKAVNEVGEVIEKSWLMDGKHTNNEAEWNAVATGIEAVCEYDKNARLIRVFGDSEIVIHQLSGLYRVKKHTLRQYYERVQNMKKRERAFSFFHVTREFNTEMDAACKRARV